MISLMIDDVYVKPYVRMTRTGKYVSKQAQEYLSSKSELAWKMQQGMIEKGYEMCPAQTPLFVTIRFRILTSLGHKCDIDNLVKTVFDAGNKILYPDDRWIDHVEATRYMGDVEQLYMEIQWA